MPSLDARMRPMNEDLVARLLIRPAAEFLELIANQDLTHRAIRPDNVFYSDAEQTRMVLGDCISSPPAIAQPTVFETIESGTWRFRPVAVMALRRTIYIRLA